MYRYMYLDMSVGVSGGFSTIPSPPPPLILLVEISMHSERIFRNESHDFVIKLAISDRLYSKIITIIRVHEIFKP